MKIRSKNSLCILLLSSFLALSLYADSSDKGKGTGHDDHGKGKGVGHDDHGNGHGYGHDKDKKPPKPCRGKKCGGGHGDPGANETPLWLMGAISLGMIIVFNRSKSKKENEAKSSIS